MKEKYKNILAIFLYLILIILGVSIIRDILELTIKDKVNNILFNIIGLSLVFIFIIILFKTKIGKHIDNIIFKKRKK